MEVDDWVTSMARGRSRSHLGLHMPCAREGAVGNLRVLAGVERKLGKKIHGGSGLSRRMGRAAERVGGLILDRQTKSEIGAGGSGGGRVCDQSEISVRIDSNSVRTQSRACLAPARHWKRSISWLGYGASRV